MSNKSGRRSERIPVALKVRWLRRSGVMELTTADINAHGMFLRCEVVLLPESLMNLEVTLPGQTVAMFAIARFVGRTVNGQGIGAEIFVIDPRQRRLWLAHYRSRCADAAAAAAAAAAVAG